MLCDSRREHDMDGDCWSLSVSHRRLASYEFLWMDPFRRVLCTAHCPVATRERRRRRYVLWYMVLWVLCPSAARSFPHPL